MATLVTGATGFVGANIVKELAGAGHHVVGLDVNVPDQLTDHFMSEVSSHVKFVQGDILDQGSLAQMTGEHSIDKIVHAAVFTVNRLPLEIQRSQDIVDINIAGTTNLLELAKGLGVSRFVYVSSGAAYGAAAEFDQMFNEDLPPAPRELYGITKYASELLVRRYGELHGFPTASVRLSTPYGPMERVTGHRAVMSVFYDWTGRALRGETIEAGNLADGRDYTYVTDIANGVRCVLDAETLPHDLYNITAGVWVPYQDLWDELVRLIPSASLTQVDVPPANSADHGASRGPLNGHRLFSDLGWTPKFDLASGLADYLQWRRDSNFLD